MKRAQIFDAGLLFVLIGAIIAILLIVDSVATETSPWKGIGQRAFEVQRTYAEAQNFVGFIAGHSRWSAPAAYVELGRQGGFSSNPVSGCGSLHNGFALWNEADGLSFCTPNAYEGFSELFRQKVSAGIGLYSQKLAERVLLSKGISAQSKPFSAEYEFLVEDGKIIGVSTIPVFFNILAPEEEFKYYAPADIFGLYTTTYAHQPYVTGTYIFRPDFVVPFAYDIGVYRELGSAATNIVTTCGSQNAVKDCIERQLGSAQMKLNERWTLSVQQDANDSTLWLVSILQDSRKSIYTNNQPPEIRFGLFVPNPKT